MSNVAKTNRAFPAFSSLWEDFFKNDLFDWGRQNGGNLPSVNVKETDKDFRIDMAAPGLKKEDFRIEVKNNVLTVSSEKKEEKEQKDDEGNYLRKEFSYQSFSRSFSLPQNADEDAIDASYGDGILHIRINKQQPAPAVSGKTIDIK